MLNQFLNESVLIQGIFWSCITIASYFFAKYMYRLWPVWFFTPVALTPLIIGSLVILLHASYQEYFQSTSWFSWIIGPITVSFAIPIYEQRQIIREHWPVLMVGVITGSTVALISCWSLALVFGLDESLRLSLLPRSISTPFAMLVSNKIGGTPELTAIFVVLTGIIGAIIGELFLARSSFTSALAKGSCLGAAAHAAGTAQAQKIGSTEGAIASLIMILMGLLNVLLVPVISYFV